MGSMYGDNQKGLDFNFIIEIIPKQEKELIHLEKKVQKLESFNYTIRVLPIKILVR